VVRDGLSVRALERIVAALLAPAAQKPPAASNGRALTPEDVEFESRVRMKFGAPVALRRGGKGGSIEIKFTSEADLIRIAEILLEE
jgi:hypothetical protein